MVEIKKMGNSHVYSATYLDKEIVIIEKAETVHIQEVSYNSNKTVVKIMLPAIEQFAKENGKRAITIMKSNFYKPRS